MISIEKAINKEVQSALSPMDAIQLLKSGNDYEKRESSPHLIALSLFHWVAFYSFSFFY